ncbi:MAG: ATP-dependent 6-phosphofructokinase [Lewinella sp.]|nr:ATP-dependent 6-phosphofructokinase [Lewinella sp.]
MKKLLVATGGGDCPGLNAVIRGIVKAAKQSGEWQVWGSMEAFNGLMSDPVDLMRLSNKKVAGIHVKGGTIIKTTNRGNPLKVPVPQADGTIAYEDHTGKIVDRINDLGFEALVNIGGDGSQRISQAMFEKGLNVVGVPKTIDNDLAATDYTFGFTTAVQIATDCFDKLVTTAESHHRAIIMEVMGRDAGWIALHTAIAGGAEICLIPEIPYDVDKIVETVNNRYHKGRGFINIVVAEGAKPKGGTVYGSSARDAGDEHFKLGGVCNALRYQLEQAGCKAEVRTTILGHIQRGGTPMAFDRILATAMGVRAFELVQEGRYGRMASFRNNEITDVPLLEAVRENKVVTPDHYLVKVARSTGISFGD